MAYLFTAPKFQAFDANGDPLAGGKVYTYAAGTLTPKATYTTQAGDTANANPVILDAAGCANIWLGTGAYKFVVTDSADVAAPFGTVDNIPGGGVSAGDVVYSPAGAGVADGTVQAKLGRFLSLVDDFGAVGDGVADDTEAIQAALDTVSACVDWGSGTYRITDTLVWDGNSVRHVGNGGFSCQVIWDGTAGGTMLETTANLRHMSSLRGIYFNANGASGAGKILHFKAFARGTVLEECLLAYCTTGSAIHLGNYSVDGQDADIAQFSIYSTQFFDNKHGIYWDSTNAAGVALYNCKLSRLSADITSHIRMERGGSVLCSACYFGGKGSTGNEYAVYIKDGWGVFELCESEFGAFDTNNGGWLYLDTPAGGLLSEYRRTSMYGCKILSRGDAANANYIYIASATHPLVVHGSSFQGKSTLTTYAINNAGAARVLSVGNYYVGRQWVAADQSAIESIGDTFNAGTATAMAPVFGTLRTITSADSPFTVTGETIVRSDSGTLTINLPLASSGPHQGGGQKRRITIIQTSSGGQTTVAAQGGETINGATSIVLAASKEYALTLVSSGGSWNIESWYTENNYTSTSTGTGTVKMGSANNANNAGWLEITPGKFVPYWTNTTP